MASGFIGVLLASASCFAQEYTITTAAGGGAQATGMGDGGPAVGAWINNPRAVAVDQAGSIYVAQSGPDIRKITPNGMISTIAGVHAPRRSIFNGGMNGIAVDASGNV